MCTFKTLITVVDVLYFALLVGSIIVALPVAILLVETIAAISGGQANFGFPSNANASGSYRRLNACSR